VVAGMSTWERESDLCRFNRAPAGHRALLPAPFAEVMARALEIAETTGGAFDPAAGALVDAWGFGPCAPGAPRAIPAAGDLAAARPRGGWRRLDFDRACGALTQPGGVALDLSAIAKGYGVDRVAGWLDGQGFESWLVEVGGELRGAGVKPDGQPWWVALERPADAEVDETFVALHDLAVATSGDYRRWFEQDGERFSHTIDPRDGRPVRHGLASVSVLHAECMTADALSTALTVMGCEAGLAFADRHAIAATFVQRTADGFAQRSSAAFEALLA